MTFRFIDAFGRIAHRKRCSRAARLAVAPANKHSIVRACLKEKESIKQKSQVRTWKFPRKLRFPQSKSQSLSDKGRLQVE